MASARRDSHSARSAANRIPRRDPEQVMRLARLGSMHQCRFSFMRVLTRRMARDRWAFSRTAFDIDSRGVGHAIYVAHGPERSYSLVAFAHDLPPEQRSDRVIATAWDATFALFDGEPEDTDVERLSQNVPLQEAGRVSGNELTLSRANRSVRLWEHVVEALAAGRQPDSEKLNAVGYLMRTTAVYGSGKFGAADYERISDRPEMQSPFQAEMLSVYLIRAFVRDLVDHMAQVRGGESAVKLDRGTARRLGIGNSTGLGLGPFIINHPVLFSNWIAAREEAISRVRSLTAAKDHEIDLFRKVLHGSMRSVANWKSDHPFQAEKLLDLKRDLNLLNGRVFGDALGAERPWNRLVTWSETALSAEGQELVASLILEPYGYLVDELTPNMADTCREAFRIKGGMAVRELRSLIERCFGWSLSYNWASPENLARVWYVSREKLEPRIGERFEEPIEPYELPLAPARDAAAAYRTLRDWDDGSPVAEFLLRHPEHRHTVRRAQVSARAPYGEIRDNTIGAEMIPIDLLRVKLAFFGATQFDPRSDRWLRIRMYAGAPYPEELNDENADMWIYTEMTP